MGHLSTKGISITDINYVYIYKRIKRFSLEPNKPVAFSLFSALASEL